MNLSIDIITAFVKFELWSNADFTAGAYIRSQLIGLPMGGPISAQLAVLYLMWAEMRATKSALSVVLSVGATVIIFTFFALSLSYLTSS